MIVNMAAFFSRMQIGAREVSFVPSHLNVPEDSDVRAADAPCNPSLTTRRLASERRVLSPIPFAAVVVV